MAACTAYSALSDILAVFVEKSVQILQDQLAGIYLHGSAAMGCFNPAKSDVGLIVVVKDSVPEPVKRAYMDMVTELNGRGPAKGIEMSVVRQDVCNPFVYPTPFELHFSAAHLAWYRKDPEDYIAKMKGGDKDLAAHFTVIRRRGKCLYGAPVREIFAEVPAPDYADSIWNDIADAENEIAANPMYLVLNLARVLAYCRDGLVLSKKEGGEWALKALPETYHSLIRDALREYAGEAEVSYDPVSAGNYAAYMTKQIRQEKADSAGKPNRLQEAACGAPET